MREILFRGKRTGNEKWICGHLLEQNIPDCHSYIVMSIIAEQDNRHIEIMEFDINEVIPETVGQYTGLTDKNGVKIFEGDIVKCTDTINDFEFNAVVEFGNPNGEYNWGYQLKFISGEDSNFDILCWVDMEETGAYIEIIGNVHDNPELLKVGDNNE